MMDSIAFDLTSSGFLPTAFMPLAQSSNWLPAFLTPLWIFAVGLVLGAIAIALVFGLLSLLSLLPPLGRLADNRPAAVTASLILGGIIGGMLCKIYVPRMEDNQYAFSVVPPLLVIGIICGFAIIYGMWYRTRREWPAMLTEGVIPYILSSAGVLVVIGLVTTLITLFSPNPLVVEPKEILSSIINVNAITDGTYSLTVNVPGIGDTDPEVAPFVPQNLNYSLRTVAEIQIDSDRTILISDSADPLTFAKPPTRVDADEPLVYRYADRQEQPIPGNSGRLHIQNRESDPATVRFTFTSRPNVPEASSIVIIATAFFLLMTGYVAFRQAAPRIWALALSTAKNEMAQPLYLLLLGLGICIVLFFGFFPFNTLDSDTNVLKDSGVTLIMVLGMLQAVWSAGTSVSEEIDGRTALTVLSKPVNRRSFLLGKYAGIMLAVLVLFIIIATVFIVVVAYKPIYESRETTRETTTWQTGLGEMMSTLPVFGLYFMETAAIAAVAVALATRLPLLANFITCFVVYVIGNLLASLVQAGGQNSELVRFVGRLTAVGIPNLANFNVQAAIDVGNSVPILYLAAVFNYLMVFVIMVWMLANLMFEDRDLA
jgi:ABC-type transport system involved in multi-copper enzyme maturation permease subunit